MTVCPHHLRVAAAAVVFDIFPFSSVVDSKTLSLVLEFLDDSDKSDAELIHNEVCEMNKTGFKADLIRLAAFFVSEERTDRN